MRRILTKKEVFDAISGVKKPPRVPVEYTTWFNPLVYTGANFFRCIWSRLRYKDDIAVCGWTDFRWDLYHLNPKNGSKLRCMLLGIGQAPPPKKKYLKDGAKGMDDNILLKDMENIDDFLKKLPDQRKTMLLFPGPSKRYKVAFNGSFLFEHHWVIRGMENALMDYYLYPDEVHKLYRWLTDRALILIKRSKKELKADAMFLCDDIGTQTGPFFSLEIFREFFKPYLKEVIDCCHSLGMHFWLHTCGNIELFLDDLVEIKLDVIHPIQKACMNQEKIFEKYKDKITFLYGFDVQHVIPEGTPDEVEEEVKRTMDLFSQANGRLVYTTGNVITGDCPIESCERLMKVSHTYNPYEKQKEQNKKE